MSITARRATRSRMVEREPVRDAAAAVVADHREALVAERAHQRDQVGGHRPLAVLRVVERGRRCRRGLGRVAVAAQVGDDEAEVGRQRARDAPPHRVRLRIAVQQQQRRLGRIAAGASEQLDLADPDAGRSRIRRTRPWRLLRDPRPDSRAPRRARADRATRGVAILRREAPICSGLRALYKFG